MNCNCIGKGKDCMCAARCVCECTCKEKNNPETFDSILIDPNSPEAVSDLASMIRGLFNK